MNSAANDDGQSVLQQAPVLAPSINVAPKVSVTREFAEVYEQYIGRVYRFCYARLGSREAAEDATSQTFMKALASFGQYRGGSMAGWLLAIARNVARDAARAASPAALSGATDAVADSQPGPERELLLRLRTRELQAAMDSLGADQRLALDLQLAGWTLVESAEAMGRSIAALKMLRARAVSNLRRRYKQEPWIFEED